VTVQGTCDQRFAAVREEFERNLAERGEVGAAVCVTVDGETVVDLWGGIADPATSVGYADAPARLSFGYSMNKQASGIGMNRRGQALVDEVYRALGYRRPDGGGIWYRPD
jgi:hypothetical protein